ncbi:hypothetical protein PILCRDRAFT_828716, partial [Piloderma croceum F 1598]
MDIIHPDLVPPGLELPPNYSNPACSAYEPRLPMDLWPNVISQLPFTGLEAATLVCQYFRKLAQPLLFQTLTVKPFTFNPKTMKISPQPDSYLKWISAKLSFCCTPRIAASVRTCDVGPQDLFTDKEGESEDPGRSMIDEVFEALVKFKSLTHLILAKVVLTDTNLAQLSRLSICPSLTLMHCTSSAPAPLRLAVKTLIFRNDAAEAGLDTLLLSMVNPNEIEVFSLVGDTAKMLLPQLPHNAVFSNLHTLCYDYSIATSLPLQPFLSRCHALEEIHFAPPTNVVEMPMSQMLDPSDLPSLHVYHGPDFGAHTFTTGRPIFHVRFWGCDLWGGSRSLDQLVPYWQELQLSSELESLEFSVNRISKVFLEQIFYLFPHLKALGIVVDANEYGIYGIYTREVLMDTLSSIHLPPEIEYLSIAKYYPWGHEDTPLKDLVRMKEYLAVYPALRYVAFSGEDFSWRFDPVTGQAVDAPRIIDDWRGAHL